VSGIEDRLRDAYRAAAQSIQTETIPGLPEPGMRSARSDPRPRRTRALIPLRGRVVLSAGAAAAAASGTAVALTTGSAPPALAAVTSALTRTLAQSYHVSMQDTAYTIRNGRTTDPSRFTCTTRADPVRHLEATSCSGDPVADADREVGSYNYEYSFYAQDGGKHWQSTRAACRPDPSKLPVFTFSSLPYAAPQQMLSLIKNAEKVTVVGPASGPGWTGTRYAFSGRNEGSTSQSDAVIGRRNGKNLGSLSGTVSVDQQGRARNLVVTLRNFTGLGNVSTLLLTFSDFGARVTVTPPPADQTFADPSWVPPWLGC
jgi:hypothetical protein